MPFKTLKLSGDQENSSNYKISRLQYENCLEKLKSFEFCELIFKIFPNMNISSYLLIYKSKVSSSLKSN